MRATCFLARTQTDSLLLLASGRLMRVANNLSTLHVSQPGGSSSSRQQQSLAATLKLDTDTQTVSLSKVVVRNLHLTNVARRGDTQAELPVPQVSSSCLSL